jgi:hypothetical protein
MMELLAWCKLIFINMDGITHLPSDI